MFGKGEMSRCKKKGRCLIKEDEAAAWINQDTV